MDIIIKDDLRSKRTDHGNRNLCKVTVALTITHLPIAIFIVANWFFGWNLL